MLIACKSNYATGSISWDWNITSLEDAFDIWGADVVFEVDYLDHSTKATNRYTWEKSERERKEKERFEERKPTKYEFELAGAITSWLFTPEGGKRRITDIAQIIHDHNVTKE